VQWRACPRRPIAGRLLRALNVGKAYDDPATVAVPAPGRRAEWDNVTSPHMWQALLPLLSSAPGNRSGNSRSSNPLRSSSPKARETCIVYGARRRPPGYLADSDGAAAT
jgi:hypothetical protein